MGNAPSYQQQFLDGLHEAGHLIITGNPVIVDTTLRTLQLAVVATAVGALVGPACRSAVCSVSGANAARD
jgi:hypothetical protein